MDKELLELIKKEANLMRQHELIEKYVKKGYSREVVMETYREVIYLFMADNVPEW